MTNNVNADVIAEVDIYKDGLFDNLSRDFPGVTIVQGNPVIRDNDLSTSNIYASGIIVEFSKPITLNLNKIYLNRASTSDYQVDFMLDNVIMYKKTGVDLIEEINKKLTFDKVMIRVNRQTIYEIEFLYDLILNNPHKNLKVENVTTTSANLSWTNADNNDFTATEIYVNGKKEATVSKMLNGYKLENLKVDSNYNVEVFAVYDNSRSSAITGNFKTLSPPDLQQSDISVSNITNVGALLRVATSGMATQPTKVIFYDQDERKIDEKNVVRGLDTTHTLTNLDENTTYTFKAQLLYGDYLSSIRSITFDTTRANRDVKNLTATSKSNEVSLEWVMPKYDSLDFARIYRKEVEESAFARVFNRANDYSPLFETNGTTFKDLTVKSDKPYTYKVTTVDVNGAESGGKSVNIRTQKVRVDGGGTTVDENGDYLITWDSPITGKIKVLVGGKEYAIVPAADRKIIIPKDQMKFDLIGMPDVQLIPISDDGNEGIPSRPGGGGGNGGIGGIVGGGDAGDILNAENLLQAGVALLGVVGAFVLLGLAFRVVPKLIKTISTALAAKKERDLKGIGGRRT